MPLTEQDLDMDECNDASILSSFLVLSTLLLAISPDNSLIYYLALVLMALVGSCGHVVFRCFVCHRPDIEKTIVCRMLVMFSYGIHFSFMCTIVSESFNILAPSWTVEIIEAHPDLTCGLFSLPIFGRNSLTFVGLLIFSVKILRHQFRGEYLEGNHTKLSKLIYFTFSIIIVIPYMVQLLVCQSFCHGMGFKRDMKNTFGNHAEIPLNDCWIPFMEFIAATCLLIVGALGVLVAFKTVDRRSHFCKNRISQSGQEKKREQAQEMEIIKHEVITVRSAPIAENQQSREIGTEAGYMGPAPTAENQLSREIGTEAGYMGPAPTAENQQSREINTEAGYMGPAPTAENQKSREIDTEAGHMGPTPTAENQQSRKIGTEAGYMGPAPTAENQQSREINTEAGYMGPAPTAENQQSRDMDTEAGYMEINTISIYSQASINLSAQQDAKWRLSCQVNCFILVLIGFSFLQIIMLFNYVYEDNILLSTIVFRGSHLLFCYGPFCIILQKENVIPWFRRKLAERLSNIKCCS